MAVKKTVPVGLVAPLVAVSVTVPMQVVDAPAGIEGGVQDTVVLVGSIGTA
jgi:hypothetical protein